jgi:hypothetical protein
MEEDNHYEGVLLGKHKGKDKEDEMCMATKEEETGLDNNRP